MIVYTVTGYTVKDYEEMVYTLTDYTSEGLCSDSLYTDRLRLCSDSLYSDRLHSEGLCSDINNDRLQ